MKILAVDTSALVATVALCDDDRLICEEVVNNGLTHSQTLMPMIDDVLSRSGTDLSQVELIVAANGPGSFTGLRIGVSCVKGMAHAKKIPVVGVSTLRAMAYNLPFSSFIVCPIMDARRDQVYNAVYKWQGTELVELKAPRALSINELLEEFSGTDEKIAFLGDGVPVFRNTISEKLIDRAVFAPVNANAQRASSLAVAGKKLFDEGKKEDGFELVPFYLRKSQAERELEEKNREQI